MVRGRAAIGEQLGYRSRAVDQLRPETAKDLLPRGAYLPRLLRLRPDLHFIVRCLGQVGLYIVPFAVGNFLGPLTLGPAFDRWGRRVMIPLTYALSGALLVATGGLFVAGALTALTQTLAWMVVFFVASAAASSAYLTVSELFCQRGEGWAGMGATVA